MSDVASGVPDPAEPQTMAHLYGQLGAQQAEIERLKRRLDATAFARELGEAVMMTATAGTIATPVPFAQLLRMIVETAADVISARSAALFLLDEAAQELAQTCREAASCAADEHHRAVGAMATVATVTRGMARLNCLGQHPLDTFLTGAAAAAGGGAESRPERPAPDPARSALPWSAGCPSQ